MNENFNLTPEIKSETNDVSIVTTSKKSYKKIILIGVGILIIGGTTLFASNSGLFQGNLFRNTRTETKNTTTKTVVELPAITKFITKSPNQFTFAELKDTSYEIRASLFYKIKASYFQDNTLEKMDSSAIKGLVESMSNSTVIAASYNEGSLLVVKNGGLVTTLSEDAPAKVKRKPRVKRKSVSSSSGQTTSSSATPPSIEVKIPPSTGAATTTVKPDNCNPFCSQKFEDYLLIASNQQIIDQAVNNYKYQNSKNIGDELTILLTRNSGSSTYVFEYEATSKKSKVIKGIKELEKNLLANKTEDSTPPSIDVSDTKSEQPPTQLAPPKYDDPFLIAIDELSFTAEPMPNNNNAVIAQSKGEATSITVTVPGYIYKKPEGGYINIYAEVQLCASKVMTGCYTANAGLIQQDLKTQVTADQVSYFAKLFELENGDEFTLNVTFADVPTKTKKVYKSGKYIMKLAPAVENPPSIEATPSKEVETPPSKEVETPPSKEVETPPSKEVETPPSIDVSATSSNSTVIYDGNLQISEVYDNNANQILYHEGIGGKAHPSVKLKFVFDPNYIESGKMINVGVDVCLVKNNDCRPTNAIIAQTFEADQNVIEKTISKEDLYYPLQGLKHQAGEEIYFKTNSDSFQMQTAGYHPVVLKQTEAQVARPQTENDLVTVSGFADKYDPLDNLIETATELSTPTDDKVVKHGPHQLSTYNYDSKDYYKMTVKAGDKYKFFIYQAPFSPDAKLSVVENVEGCSTSGTFETPSNEEIVYAPSEAGTFCFVYKTTNPTNTAYTLAYQWINAPIDAALPDQQ